MFHVEHFCLGKEDYQRLILFFYKDDLDQVG